MNHSQARKVFEGRWISKLLANFESTDEVQRVALATLWTVLEEGQIRMDKIIKLLGICSHDEMTVTLPDTLRKVGYAIANLKIPVQGELVPFMVRDDRGASRHFNPDLREWEEEIIQAIEEELPMIFPSSIPVVARDKQYIDGTWVIKHSVTAFKDQSERTAPLVFKALNILNSQGYRLNKDMMKLTNLVEDINLPVGQSPVHRLNKIRMMNSFKGEFFFKYTMDFRGRIYARSVVATPQGDSFAKAVLDSSRTRELGKEGVQALAIHFANQCEHDKDSYKDRIRWALTKGKALAAKLAACEGDWFQITRLLTTPNNFEEYTAAMDWHRCMTSEDPAKYRSSLICHQDATNSGFQFGAALLKDDHAAAYVNITANLTADDKPADLYGNMAHNLLERVTDPKWRKVITRKFCKKPIMVTGYGAGEAKVTEVVETYLADNNIALNFDEIKTEFFLALTETVGSMVEITKVMKDHAKDLLDRGEEVIRWTTPDGFKVYHTYRDNSARKIKLTNSVSAIRAKRRGEVDPIADQMVGALPPNFIHSMDGAMLREAARWADHAGIAFCPIHDSFGTHAADYWTLHKILKTAFIETMQHRWYSNFCKTNAVRQKLQQIGSYNLYDALRAAYMFS